MNVFTRMQSTVALRVAPGPNHEGMRSRWAARATCLLRAMFMQTMRLCVRCSVSALCCFLTLLMFFLSVNAFADCPDCGPRYCTNTVEYQSSLAQKKRVLVSAGYPTRLIKLFDKLAHCQGCIETAPDGFNVFSQSNSGAITIKTWTKEDESAGAAAVKAHSAKACYVIISRRTCSCCKEPKYNERADYDTALDLNKDPTIACQ
jgi:hypothetical protein